MKNSNEPTSFTRAPMLGKYIIFSVTLFILILAFSSAGFLLSMRTIIRDNKGRELTKLLELEKIKLENYVNKEIAIVLKMASSPIISKHFENPSAEDIKQLALDEIAAYRNVLMGQVFWINDIDKLFHFDNQEPYWLDINLPENYWYPMTMYDTKSYNFNINYNPNLNVTNLWINAPVFSKDGKPIGMLGIGIDLTAFIGDLYDIYKSDGRDVSFYFFNDAEEVTGAKDIALVAGKSNIREVLGQFGAHTVESAKSIEPGTSYTFAAQNGQAAVISIPLLEWYAVAFLPDNIDDYKTPLTTFFILGITIIAFILILSNIVIAQLLKPLRETMSSLIAASKAKSDFLAKMSHEIRTPMNAILGVAQVQLEKEKLPEDYKDAFNIIHNSSTTLLGIINDILDLSKIETGKLILHPIEYDVPSLICDVVQLNITRIGSKEIDFKLFINENLPTKLIGDDLRLKQILNNILSNSFKYTDSGSVTLSISYANLTDTDITLMFVIEDTGQGIKEEDRKRLFSEYMRLNPNVNRNIEGTGLGLNIAKRLATMMDGTISVESVYKKGSTFTVTVKQQLAQNAGVLGAEYSKNLQNFSFASIMRSASKQIKRDPIPNGSVLVVDDVETNLIIAEMMLSPYELKIDKATSGKSAIEKINGGNVYDIVFMDHMMPEMDGIETTKILRANGYQKTIIALTANAIVGNKEMFIASGFNDFLSKPIDIEELDKMLNAYIRNKQDSAASAPQTNVGAVADSTSVSANESQKIFSHENNSSAQGGAVPRVSIKMDDRFIAALRKDVERSIVMIRESLVKSDMKLFTTTVHGLKSAFAAIGEKTMSQAALELELAGRNNNTEIISANIESFIEKLKETIGDERDARPV